MLKLVNYLYNCDSLDSIQGFSLIETYNGKAYYISNNTFDNWDEARSACISAGGDLISIESEELNNFLYQNLSPSVNNYWIGLFQDLNSEYYQEPNFGWMWVNGNPLSFTNWDTHGDYLADEPNNLNIENFGMMYGTSDCPVDENNDGICDVAGNDPFSWNDEGYNHSYLAILEINCSEYCSKSDTVNVEFINVDTSYTNITVCDSYEWNGITYIESGIYTFSTTSTNGCDSIATLNLIINNSSSSSEDVTACDSYEWNGVTYSESGVYTFESTNEFGCTDVATLNLTINYSSTSSEDVTACDNHDWNGNTYSESGVYTFVSTNVFGCDSTALLNLTINQTDTSFTQITACDSYEWNGETYNESGTYEYSNIENNNNYSLNFDGDDYVIFPADQLPTGEKTVTLYFKTDIIGAISGYGNVLLGYGGTANNPTGATSWQMSVGIECSGAQMHLKFKIIGTRIRFYLIMVLKIIILHGIVGQLLLALMEQNFIWMVY